MSAFVVKADSSRGSWLPDLMMLVGQKRGELLQPNLEGRGLHRQPVVVVGNLQQLAARHSVAKSLCHRTALLGS